MAEAPITNDLRNYLDEVNFVYHHLPPALDRTGVVSDSEHWSAFFHKQAAALRVHQGALRATVQLWGMPLRSCICAEVSEGLNEIRHAHKSRNRKPILESTVLRVLAGLRSLVLKRLDEAVDLATRIRETELAVQLRALWGRERREQVEVEKAQKAA